MNAPPTPKMPQTRRSPPSIASARARPNRWNAGPRSRQLRQMASQSASAHRRPGCAVEGCCRRRRQDCPLRWAPQARRRRLTEGLSISRPRRLA
eukprot:358326-Chlamydomonas_euryale.AAC.4